MIDVDKINSTFCTPFKKPSELYALQKGLYEGYRLGSLDSKERKVMKKNVEFWDAMKALGEGQKVLWRDPNGAKNPSYKWFELTESLSISFAEGVRLEFQIQKEPQKYEFEALFSLDNASGTSFSMFLHAKHPDPFFVDNLSRKHWKVTCEEILPEVGNG